MERYQVIQELLNLFPSPKYLEIGVNQGATFHKLSAKKKIAVDPEFLFDEIEAAKTHVTAEYHRCTSDEYFAERIDPLAIFDVVFIDGLHTFEQSLRDLQNAMCFVRRDSIIIIDDVLPDCLAASLRDADDMIRLRKALADPGMSWMGDVYRLIFFIENFIPQYSYATVAENHGQTILWREPRSLRTTLTIETVSRLAYVDTILHRQNFSVQPLAQIVSSLERRGR